MTSRPAPTSSPIVRGLLAASAASVRAVERSAAGGRREHDEHGDAFEIGVDERERLYAVLVSVGGARHEAARVLGASLGLVRAGASAQRIVAAIEAGGVGLARGVGLTFLRFDQPAARVELLNAGMPPVACLLPGSRLVQYPARSVAVARDYRQLHPYELLPLVWGSAWVVVSPGLAGASANDAAVAALLDAPALREPSRIASGPSEAAQHAVESLLAGRERPARDASLIVVDSSRRERTEHKSIPGTGGSV